MVVLHMVSVRTFAIGGGTDGVVQVTGINDAVGKRNTSQLVLVQLTIEQMVITMDYLKLHLFQVQNQLLIHTFLKDRHTSQCRNLYRAVGTTSGIFTLLDDSD